MTAVSVRPTRIGTRAARGRDWTSPAVLAGYLVVSFCFFGVRVLAHPESRHIGGLFTDPQIFVWSLAWWPHALLHGENPFFTHAIWSPDGFNLAWATSVPGLAIVLAPLTWAFGPVFSYNVASVLMPALAAWTSFLLCRYLTASLWPSLAGGYLFGFSAYVLGAQLTHIHTVAVFLVPVAALVVLRFLDGALDARGLAWRTALLVAAQLSLSTEVLFTLTVALACSLVLAFAVAPGRRERLVRSVAPLAAGYGVAAVVAAPFVYYLVAGSGSSVTPGVSGFTADLLNVVVPTRASFGGWWTSAIAARFPANDVERGAYIGLPTLAIVAWYAVARRRTPAARFLVAGLVLALIAALGSWLTVAGHRVATLPWVHVAGLPLFRDLMDVRFAMFAALAAAVTVALWAASAPAPRWVRAALPALAILAVLPNLSWGAWARTPDVPRLFTGGGYRDCIARGENVVVFPVGPRGDSLIWQAESGFWFRMAGGYISQAIPPSFTRPAGLGHLTSADNPSEVTAAQIRELARLKGVTKVIVDARQAALWRPILRPLGPPIAAAGTLIYRLRGASPVDPACGRPATPA